MLPVIIKKLNYVKKTMISPFNRHIGLYAYTYDALEKLFEWDVGQYEYAEGREKMRFFENNVLIKMVKVDCEGRKGMSGIDSTEDVL